MQVISMTEVRNNLKAVFDSVYRDQEVSQKQGQSFAFYALCECMIQYCITKYKRIFYGSNCPS